MATRQAHSNAGDDVDDSAPSGESWGVQVPMTAPPDPRAIAEEDIGDRLRAALAEVPGDHVRVALYRREARTRDLQWCVDYTPAQAETGIFELIREEWGAGTYELRAIGARGLITRLQLNIAEKRGAAVAPASPVSDALATALQSIAQTQAEILRALSQRQENPAPSMIETLRLAKEFLTPAPAVAQPVAPADPLSSITQMAAAMRAMRELSSEINPPADPDNPMSLAAPLIDMIRGVVSNRQSVPETMPTMALPESMQNAPQQVEETETVNPIQKMALQGAIARLCQMADAKADPVDGGRFIHSIIPDEMIGYMQLPNWFDIMCNIAPDLATRREWIEAAKVEADRLFAGADG